MKKFIIIIAIILILCALIFDAGNMILSIAKAVDLCLYTIIPALFGFMAIASYLIKSGLYRVVFKPLYIVMRYVIKLNEEEFGIFLLSLFGGYPIGVKLISDSESKITRLLPYCYCPSPGFVIAVVGVGIFKSIEIGIAVYVSNVLACVLIALVLNMRNKNKMGERSTPPVQKTPLQLNINTFNSSVMSAASSLFPVCAVITAFGVITGAFRFYGLQNPFLFSTLEISNISALPASLPLLPLYAAMFSLGGLCIIMQIPALSKGKLPLKSFFLWRIPAALLSALLCFLIMQLADFNIAVTVSTRASLHLTAQNPIASVSLLIMSMILIKTAEEKII